MSAPHELLLAAVREACNATQWACGVALQRSGAVRFESEDQGTIRLRVAGRSGVLAPLVTLAPDDPSWSCECPARSEACEHVAAAALVMAAGLTTDPAELEAVAATLTAARSDRIGYRLEATPAGLRLTRIVTAGGQEVALQVSLAALADGRVEGPRVLATRADLEVDRALSPHSQGGILPRERLARLFAALARCDDVRLDGVPVSVSLEPIVPLIRIRDRGEGFWVELIDDPRVAAQLAGGVVRLADRLALRGESALTARDREELARGRFVPAGEVARLVSELLPRWTRLAPVVVETERLPRGERLAPRIVVATARDRDLLTAEAQLVYGDPPRARVVDGRLLMIGDGPVPMRDVEGERRLLQQLRASLSLDPGVTSRFEATAAIEFAARLARWPGATVGDAHRSFRLEGELQAEVRFERGFAVSFRVPGGAAVRGGSEVVLQAWRRGERIVPLDSGRFAPLPDDWLARYGALVADLLAARGAHEQLPASSFAEQLELAAALGLPAPEGALAVRARLERALDGELPLPPDATVELRGYQRDGVRQITALGDAGLGVLLADDMGLGKTVQALCSLRGRTLVVAPASVRHNWLQELSRFRPGLRGASYHGAGRHLDATADVIVTTYAILRLDAERLGQIAWETVILDEAGAIKNPDSQLARAAQGLRAPRRLALSGTPVENRLEELWSIMEFLNPGWLGPRSRFQQAIALPIAAGDGAAAERLQLRIRPVVIRRLKRDVAPELPARIEQVQRCELDAEERAVYESLRLAARQQVAAQVDGRGAALDTLEALLRLRQACCDRALVPGGGAGAPPASSKLQLLIELLETALAEGHKVLVFTQWTSLLDRIEPLLRAAGWPFLRLDGSTRQRGEVVAAFQSEHGPPVLLLSLKAGGVGLNLTAADQVVLLDPWWNPAAEDQAADRAHRIGQLRPVLITRLIASETIEEQVLELQAHKRRMTSAALGSEGRLDTLDREQLLALLA